MRLLVHSVTLIFLYKSTGTIIAFRSNKIIKNVFTASDTYSNPSNNYVLIVGKFWWLGFFGRCLHA